MGEREAWKAARGILTQHRDGYLALRDAHSILRRGNLREIAAFAENAAALRALGALHDALTPMVHPRPTAPTPERP